MVRVAALQFASGTDVADNLATCLRMIDRAAAEGAALLVLPEFCNHISWYDDAAHAYRVAVDPDGDFLGAIAERARRHGVHIAVNCSVRRGRGDARITVTSTLFGPDGRALASADKQTLMGHENDYFVRAEAAAPVVETPFGRVSLYPCRDGVTMETPRCLALQGAQILCNSLNSFALDEASLHVPARAPENRAFVVAANKVGPLIPEHLLEPVSAATRIPVEHLMGAGESQIVGPDGAVLAKGPRTGEAVVVADIDPARADDKLRPDGTHIFRARRPELYAPIAAEPLAAELDPAAPSLSCAVYQPAREVGFAGIEEVNAAIGRCTRWGVELCVLPELFCFEGGVVRDPEAAVERSQYAITRLVAACARSRLQIVTSVVERDGDIYRHVGVLIDAAGVQGRQPQLHPSARHPWAAPGDALRVFPRSFGRLAIVVGDDAIFPETCKLAALAGAHVIAVPFDAAEPWETEIGLPSRAAENRVCLVAATRPKPFASSVMCSLERDFTLMTPWQSRTFDGNINLPITTRARQKPGMTRAMLSPECARNKVMSKSTHLLDGRPWRLSGELVRT